MEKVKHLIPYWLLQCAFFSSYSHRTLKVYSNLQGQGPGVTLHFLHFLTIPGIGRLPIQEVAECAHSPGDAVGDSVLECGLGA